MRTLRIAGFVVGAAAILVIGGVAVVARQFDADRIKSELAKAVQEKHQRTLKIDGDLELGFWPKLGIRLGKLSLSERASAREFASVEAMRLSVAVMPLLSKRVVVDIFEVDGVNANIIRHADGTLNIDDLLSSDKSGSPPMQIDIAGIKLADAQFAWRDEKSGSTATVSGLGLTTGRVQADTGRKTFQVDDLMLAVKSTDGDARLRLSGVEGAGRALKVARLVFEFGAESGAASFKGALTSTLAADLEHQTLALEGFSGNLDFAHPQLPAKHLKLPLSGTLRADFAQQSATGNLATQFDASKAALKFDVTKFAPPVLGFNLDIDRLDVDKYLPKKTGGKKAGGDQLDFSALKSMNLSGTVTIGSLLVANVKATNIRLQVKAANGKLDIAPASAKAYGVPL